MKCPKCDNEKSFLVWKLNEIIYSYEEGDMRQVYARNEGPTSRIMCCRCDYSGAPIEFGFGTPPDPNKKPMLKSEIKTTSGFAVSWDEEKATREAQSELSKLIAKEDSAD